MKLADALKIFGAVAAGSTFLALFLLLGEDEQQWEFLVRLEDKINTQVFCLNPAHEGNHMDRVFFEDNTFSASCPSCNSVEFLYRKNNAITKKGHFITFKPEGWSWGSNERKHYGIVKISCTYEQAQALCEGIKNEQAEADVITYRAEGNKSALRLAEIQVMVDERPRKHIFNFETQLTVEQLSNWRDKEKYSGIVIISDLAEVQ